MVLTSSIPSIPVCRERVVSVHRQQDSPTCVLANRTEIRVSYLLARYIATGDEITFPIPSPDATSVEIYITKDSPSSGLNRCLYQAPIGYVTQPKLDKRNQSFVSAEVQQKELGISAILLPCGTLRDYFYRVPGAAPEDPQPNFYETLRIPATASPAELRVAYKLRTLELVASARSEQLAVERAFNILGQPELRACYDALLADTEAPAIFPYGGFGSLLASGERSRDGSMFFAQRIIAFLPEQHQLRFRIPLRKCDFYHDRALYRDIRRKLELWIDPAVLHTVWDVTWNQWKHLLGTKMEVNASFVKSGHYRGYRNEWQLVTWETALPSRLQVRLPADFQQQVEAAKLSYHRFGQYSAALDKIRAQIQDRPAEKGELARMLSSLNVPGDFDVAQISWRPDYDPFFYQELSRRARRIYLFRDEYIFDLEKVVVIETPQLGNATYVFSKPRTMESFLAIYTGVSKHDIRHNRNNVAEKLGFLCRIIHGSNPRSWAKELRVKIGGTPDFAAAARTGVAGG